MRRFFGEINKNNVILNSETLKHFKVVRIEEKEQIEILTPEGEVYLTSYEEGKLNVITKLEKNAELQSKLVLIYAMPKGEKFELVLQKACELGVSDIYPLNSKYVIKRMTKGQFAEKKERYKKILCEATLQSNRNKVPVLHDLCEMKEINKIECDKKFIAYEEEASGTNLINETMLGKSIALVIGCEGGFAADEVSFMNQLGYQNISLGTRILRSETAAIYGLSIFSYLLEAAKNGF